LGGLEIWVFGCHVKIISPLISQQTVDEDFAMNDKKSVSPGLHGLSMTITSPRCF
jgi:hypothetical protein